jgi:putative integral membrane protein (TIGR02587 family)
VLPLLLVLRDAPWGNPLGRGLALGRASNAAYARELARAAGGAILFSFPLMMTMEMWWLGFHIDRGRLALFLVVGLVLLVGLARHVGFHAGRTWLHDGMDALSAFAVAALVSTAMLAIFGVIAVDMPASEIVGKIAIQTVPAGIGAILARKQFAGGNGDGDEADDEEGGEARDAPAAYGSELFLMFGGAVFVAFNVAPTDEVAHIADLTTPWHALVLALLSLALLHVLVYRVEFAGQESWPEGHGFAAVFVRYSLAGYGVALAVSLYVLWTFGRLDGNGLGEVVMMTTILGFPAALGAATARLVV